jgi:integrase
LEQYIINTVTKKTYTLSSIFEDFLIIRKDNVAATSWRKDLRHFNTFIVGSSITDILLKDLTLVDGYQFFNYCKKLKPEMKRKYWNNIIGTLNCMFQYAINECLIDTNPFANMKLNQNQFTAATKTKDSDTIFSAKEQIKVCNLALLDSRSKGTTLPLGIILLFNLGLRIGELCALKWMDIETNYKGKFIHIQREMVDDVDDEGKSKGKIVLEHCKSPAGDRRLLLNTMSIKLLNQIKQMNKVEGFPTTDDDFIFLRFDKGNIILCTDRCFTSRLVTYCKKSGMKVNKSPHDIRRTTLTNLFRAGMSLKAIQAYAGHSTLKQTMDYIRVSDDDDIMQYLEALSEPNTNMIPFKLPNYTLLEQSGTGSL